MWIVKQWSGLREDVATRLVKTEKDTGDTLGRVFGRDPRRRGSMSERGTPWPSQG